MDTKTLERLRKEIDMIDRDIIGRLAERARVSKKIGELKKKENERPLDTKRMNAVLQDRADAGAKKALSPLFVRRLFALIHKESVAIQKKV